MPSNVVVEGQRRGIPWTPIVLVGGGLLTLFVLSRKTSSGDTLLASGVNNALSNLNPFKGMGLEWGHLLNNTSSSDGSGTGKVTNGDSNGGGTPPIVHYQKTIVPSSGIITRSAGNAIGIAGRGFTAAALLGRPIPLLPGSSFVAKSAEGMRIAATRSAEKLGARIAEKEALEVGESIGERGLIVAAKKTSFEVGGRVASRAVPVVGWGLMLADVGADISRVFGLKPPSWLGFSSIITPFTGSNPIEYWASER